MKINASFALCIGWLFALSSDLPAIAADTKQSAAEKQYAEDLARIKREAEKLRATQKPFPKEEVLKVAKELNEALVAKNFTALDRMLAKDYSEVYEEDVMSWNGRNVNVLPTPKKVPGKKRTGEEILAGLKSGALRFASLQTTNEDVTNQANAAFEGGQMVIYSARLIEKSSQNGKDTSGEFLVTRTYSKRDGKWVCTDSSLTPIVPVK
jgi:hypothetical protein